MSMTRREALISGVLGAAAAVGVAGCSATSRRSLGFGGPDVDVIEVYQYDYSAEPSEVRMVTITDRRAIYDFANAYTDVPVSPLGNLGQEAPGKPAAGLRFMMRDGSSVELTQVGITPGSVILFWPGGEVVQTEWGTPVGDTYPAVDPADPADRPRAELP